MKYILIIGGIILSFLSDLFEKEKEEGQTKHIKLKRFTWPGLIVLFGGLALSIAGLWQAFSEETEAKVEKEKIELKSKMDSINFAKKNFSDSVRFTSIISELNSTQAEIVRNTNNIVSTTLQESNKSLEASRRNQFLVPDRLEVSFVAELIFKNEDLKKCKEKLKLLYGAGYKADLNPDFIAKIEKSDSALYFLHKLGNGFVFYDITFYDNSNQVIFYVKHMGGFPLDHWNLRSENKNSRYKSEFMTSYIFSDGRFLLYGNNILTDVKRTSNSNSLLDIEKGRVDFQLAMSTQDMAEDFKYFVRADSKLLNLSIKAPGNLELSLFNFRRVRENYFTRNLDSQDSWK